MSKLLFGSWIVQCLSATTVAVVLPRSQWMWKLLAGLSAVADVVEMLLVNGTDTYAYTYWSFRILELLLLTAAVCHTAARTVPGWAFALWSPMVWAGVATISNGLPRSNDQMQTYQMFMLSVVSITALFSIIVFWGTRASEWAIATFAFAALQLACTAIWRWHSYNAGMWIAASLTGLLILGLTARQETQPGGLRT